MDSFSIKVVWLEGYNLAYNKKITIRRNPLLELKLNIFLWRQLI